jgi:predicted nucleic-acid-binding protein
MELVDANIILRYVLDDNPELSEKAAAIIDNRKISIPFEVAAEVTYVLEKLYKIGRDDIYQSIIELMSYPNVTTFDDDVLTHALEIYKSSNLDFVDTILISYNKVRKYIIHSFDKDLNKRLLGREEGIRRK